MYQGVPVESRKFGEGTDALSLFKSPESAGNRSGRSCISGVADTRAKLGIKDAVVGYSLIKKCVKD